MKKNIILITALAATLCSCNDFLDREPLDAVSTEKYLLTESDLAAYTANLYNWLPSHKPGQYNIGVFGTDNNSDNQVGSTPNELFIKGQTRVGQSGGVWKFNEIRTVNYFINKVRPLLEKGELGGTMANNEHYLGEAYFFRAVTYFNKLDSIGDFPIIKNWITEDYETVREASKRRPRNEVARFIMQDLDSAYYYMKNTPPVTNRLTKDCAALFKSRVALFEGTWEKYHQGTSRVPGGPGWPGANKDYLKDFQINIGSEIDYFLTEAKKAAQIIADAYPLSDDYEGMFNSKSLSPVKEVLLWRAFNSSLTPSVNHFVVSYLQTEGGGNTGYTRSMMQTYLMKNGLPIYAPGANYQQDVTYANVAQDRDPRLVHNTLLPGDILSEKAAQNECVDKDGKGIYYRAPIIQGQLENRCPTGYSMKKGLTPDPEQGPTLPSETACVIFRAAEAYLNYIEADCELNNGTKIDANSAKYWKALRARADMEQDYMISVNNTDLNQELDFARYSGSSFVSSLLYNIRRERRVELAAEGFRLKDLRRWRALDKMQNFIVEGFNLWDENYKRYSEPEYDHKYSKPGITLNVMKLIEPGKEGANISAKSDSKYIRPYRVNSNNLAYNGYSWNQNKYLYPIAFDHFRLTTATEGSSDYESSTIYQNPGWKIETSSLAEGD